MADKNLLQVLGNSAYTTTLSAGLHDLICNVGISDSDQQPVAVVEVKQKLKCQQEFLDFDRIAKSFPDEDKSSAYFKQCVQTLAPLFKKSEETWCQLSMDDFKEKYGHYFLWTRNVEVLMDCHEMLRHNKPGEDVLCLLVLSSVLERALGNVYLLKGSQCPTLLKDLLSSAELKHILGDSVMQILQVLMGPPISLNLRNVAWHGFFSEGELSPRYMYFLIHITASIGRQLEESDIHVNDIPCRSFVSLHSTDLIAELLPSFPSNSSTYLEKEILQSWLVNQKNRNLYQLALQCYYDQLYDKCSMLLFTLLEHALRRLFVTANNCPHRLVTAETTTLFTTFEEILERILPDGKVNMVSALLGESCMDFLYDLLIYPCGPRARDKLGHGEVDLSTVPHSLCQILLNCFVFLAQRFGTAQKANTEQNCSFNVHKTFDRYQSIFHSMPQLRYKMVCVAHETSALSSHIRYTPDLEPRPCEILAGNLTEDSMQSELGDKLRQFIDNINTDMEVKYSVKWIDLKKRLMVVFSDTEALLNKLVNFKIHTLFRWQKDTGGQSESGRVGESEIVGHLTRVMCEVLTSLSQTKTALELRQDQLMNKQLRSRQRENLKKLLLFCPNLSMFCQFVLAVASWIFCCLDGYSTWHTGLCKAVQKFLKIILQTSENLRTYTSADKNMWVEAGKITLTVIDTAMHLSKSIKLCPPEPL